MKVSEVAENIKSVKIQGAKEIAIYALKFLRNFCKKNGFGLKFEVAAMVLEQARPTAVVLHNCIEILKENKNIKTIDKLIRELEASTEKIAKVGSKLINCKTILTHCHSGEALSVIKALANRIEDLSVIATVTEPLEQGVKTAKELVAAGIPVTLITDNAVGHFMKEVDCVIVGTDAIRVVQPMGVVNKIGTRNLAIAAAHDKKKFIVVGSTFKIDKRKKFVIEERPVEEISNKLKTKLNKKIRIRNPAFDLVEFDLVDLIINEYGGYKPKDFLRKFGEKNEV